VMVLIGFGFKVAAAPFHLWAPDAYQGAPTPSSAFIASGSKVAGFFILARFMMLAFAGVEGRGAWGEFAAGWVPVMAVVALSSMVLGNLAAIVQSSVKRLLAYSAIAHGGYMLLAVMSHDPVSLASLMYYVITYGVTVVGAFGVVSVVERATGGEAFSNFAGLSRRAPLLSLCMLVFVLSLAGIPPLAGFFAKFYVFAAALKSGSSQFDLLWLVIVALGFSAVSLYYYLQVLKQVYVVEAPDGWTPIRIPVATQALLCALGLIVLLLGCVPGLLLGPLLSVLAP
jgi:NADH-quinone oxidoreductase subunit N